MWPTAVQNSAEKNVVVTLAYLIIWNGLLQFYPKIKQIFYYFISLNCLPTVHYSWIMLEKSTWSQHFLPLILAQKHFTWAIWVFNCSSEFIIGIKCQEQLCHKIVQFLQINFIIYFKLKRNINSAGKILFISPSENNPWLQHVQYILYMYIQYVYIYVCIYLPIFAQSEFINFEMWKSEVDFASLTLVKYTLYNLLYIVCKLLKSFWKTLKVCIVIMRIVICMYHWSLSQYLL